MDTEPQNIPDEPAQDPAKPSLRQRANDRWSSLSDRLKLVTVVVAGLVILLIGFGAGACVGHGGGHHGDRGYHDRGHYERCENRHHHRDYCAPTSTTTTAPTTTAPTTTVAPTTSAAVPATPSETVAPAP